MGTQRFDVVTRLGSTRFDDASHARSLLRMVRAELRTLRRHDPRIARIVWRRGPHGEVDVVTTIAAGTAWEAVELVTATVRSAIHAAGGATVAWERFTPAALPIVGATAHRSFRLSRPSARGTDVPVVAPGGTWAAAASAERERNARFAPVPSFVPPPSAPMLIDLR